MRIDTRILKSVLFIGTASYGAFRPVGTGFVVCVRYDDEAFQMIVTARHVIEKIAGADVHVRLNTKGGGTCVMVAPKADWVFHTDDNIDLAACPTVLRPDDFDILHIDWTTPMVLTEAARQEENVGVGDDVATVGLFVPHTGENRNLPIVRSGTIAAMPTEKIRTQYGRHDAYLVETRSIDGLSGSPAFVQIHPIRPVEGGLHRGRRTFYFIGVMLGHNNTTNPTDEVQIGDDQSVPAPANTVPTNTGIGIVLPHTYVHELIETHPTFLAMRKETVERRRKISDASPASA